MGPAKALDRSRDAASVAHYLGEARGRLAVLYGRRGSGKSELMRHWVAPLLARSDAVYYGECGRQLPDRMLGPAGETDIDWSAPPAGVYLLDEFDRLLAEPDRVRREELKKALGAMRAGRQDVTIVLVVCEDNLREALALRSSAPEILDHLWELPEVTLDEGLGCLARAATGGPRAYESELLDALRSDLENFREKSVSPALVEAVHEGLCRLTADDSVARTALAAYMRAGNLKGVLKAYLDSRLEALAQTHGPEAQEAGREILSSLSTGAAPDLEEITARTGIPEQCMQRALQWLAQESGLIREATGKRVDLLPVQLAELIVEEDALTQSELAPMSRLLAQSVKSWMELGSALPVDRFESLDRLRKKLRASSEEAALMAYCALRYSEGGDDRAAKYWLGRVRERTGRVAVLLRALDRQEPHARLVAARLLRQHDDAEVRYELYRRAVEDPEARVRREAVSSLRLMQAGDLRQRLLAEAGDPANPYQENAVAALGAYTDGEMAEALQAMVGDSKTRPGIRHAAITALAAIESPASVATLVDICLNDEDREDREQAAESLSAIPSKALQETALAGIRDTRVKLEQRAGGRAGAARLLWAAGRLALAFLVVLGNVGFHGLALLVLGRPRAWLGFFGLQVLATVLLFIGFGGNNSVASAWGGLALLLNLAVSQALAFRAAAAPSSKPEKRPELRYWIGFALFAANALSTFLVVHGLAYMLLKRVRRGLILLGLQVLGVGCWLILDIYPDLFAVVELPVRGFWENVWRLAPSLVGRFYSYSAFVLILGTYVVDVAGGAYLALRSRERAEACRRRAFVYRAVLANQQAAELTLEGLKSADAPHAAWAGSLVRRFATAMPWQPLVDCLKKNGVRTPRPVLEALARAKQDEEPLRAVVTLWKGADAGFRSRVLRVLGSRPTERSLKYLERLTRSAVARERLRYWAAELNFLARLWPKPLLVLGCWAAPVLLVLLAEGVATARNPARPMIKELRASTARARQWGAAWPADILAANDQNVRDTATYLARRFPNHSAPALAELFKSAREAPGNHLRGTRSALLESLGTLASASPELSAKAALAALGESLDHTGDPVLRVEILKTLASAAEGSDSWEAQTQARNILAGRARLVTLGLLMALDGRQQQGALTALEEGRTPETTKALAEVAFATEADLRQTARWNEAVPSDPTRYEERQRLLQQFREIKLMAMQSLNRVDSDASRRALDQAAAAPAPGPRALDATEQLVREQLAAGNRAGALRILEDAARTSPRFAWAYYMQAQILFEDKAYARAEPLATKAAELEPDDEWNLALLREIFVQQRKVPQAVALFEDLSRRRPQSTNAQWQLAYLFHEVVSQTNPELGYRRALEVNQQVRQKIKAAGEAEGSDANLAECYLTTGQYARAVAAGRQLASRTSSGDNRVAMRLVAYAALLAQQDYAEAERELDNLQSAVRALRADDQTTWMYEGTLYYLTNRAGIAEPARGALVKLVGAINDLNKNRKSLRQLPPSLFEENRQALRSRAAKAL